MGDLPVQTSRKQLRRQVRMDIAVLINGYFNLDVRNIWIGRVATSNATKVTQPDINPMAGVVSDRDF